MNIRIESLGCRLNIGEMEALGRHLAARGHTLVGPGQQADLCILNTCTVTAVASRKSRQVLRQLRRSNPGAAIVATGCDAEMAPDRLRSLGLDLVVGNDVKDRLADELERHGLLVEPLGAPTADATPAPAEAGRTRAFLKVQDGCDNRCTFCVVTLARGSGRSRDADDVAREVRQLCGAGFREVVLSGVHLGSWGQDLVPRRGLPDLVHHVLEVTGIERLRLSSVEPWDLTDDFFELYRDARVLPHLHLPLQSGCDATLRRMARRTTRREFEHLMRHARSVVPEMSISTDVIVGFPGETEAEFEASIAAVDELAFSRLHVFRYSRRDGTLAATMSGQVPGDVAAHRSRRMHARGAALEERFNRRFLGRSEPVLWEVREPFGDGLRWSGLTPHYVRVHTETATDVDLTNRVTDTRLVEPLAGALLGHVPGVSVDRMVEPAPGPGRLPVLRTG
jgi:threonylcarbamoyladenosine tRNA methylthiotransferase MtaB